jgi:soluble lytic murein transglycosylase
MMALRFFRSNILHGFRYAATAALASALLAGGALAQSTEHNIVVSARQALNARQWDQLSALVPSARGSVLGAYPEYWLLRQQIHETGTPLPMPAITRFIQARKGTCLEQRLRGDAIRAAARMGDFTTVLRLADGLTMNTSQTDCAILHAQHVKGEDVSAAKAAATFVAGSNCWDMYDTLVARNIVQFDTLSQQLRDYIDVDELAPAQRLARYMFDEVSQKQFGALLNDPRPWLVRNEGRVDDPRSRELAVVALARLARKDMLNGYEYFRRTWAPRLPAADRAWVQAHFGLLAALRQNPVAHRWYQDSDGARISDYNAEWRVRAALRETPVDWKWVLRSIEQMPAGLRDEPAWRYWRARGLAATGRTREAHDIYISVAGKFDYYGQLAAEELGELTSIPPAAPKPTPREMAEARANPGLQRALALFELGWRSEAVPEWNFALRGMTDRQLLAAAELARQHHIYDRVVNTSELTREQHDFTQRFLAPFQGQVTAKAREIGLDPAWVYGLIRQESRFITNARSGVGASGLMQLMPATARWVARKIGMSDFQPARVNDFDVNTTLGTNYLNIVLQDLNGSQLLASAGYNAGPKRPHNWRSTYSGPVEGAIFAEAIPFAETRQYVQKVLSNATYYTALFTGQPQSLKKRLGTVVPQMNETTAIP